ncbi:hypothetical protein [Actinomadura keratinilytica]|uniref:hypothetical protein n=1 Tax=Actinomadura keratinilytica TaxID=547461 RepID=UPI00360EA680
MGRSPFSSRAISARRSARPWALSARSASTRCRTRRAVSRAPYTVAASSTTVPVPAMASTTRVPAADGSATTSSTAVTHASTAIAAVGSTSSHGCTAVAVPVAVSAGIPPGC